MWAWLGCPVRAGQQAASKNAAHQVLAAQEAGGPVPPRLHCIPQGKPVAVLIDYYLMIGLFAKTLPRTMLLINVLRETRVVARVSLNTLINSIVLCRVFENI